MKKIAYLISILFSGIMFSQAVVPAFAADTLGGQKLLKETTHVQNQASNAANRQQNELQNIIKRADGLISNRITSLNALSQRVQNDNRLSSSEKSSLSTEIQTDITGLTNLKTKIDADTDAATARSDAKQIITNYYVYAAFEPKVRLLVTLNNLQAETGYIQALVPQLQTLINTFKSQGKDVTQLQSLLNDISTQLQTINTTITNDIAAVQNISTTTKPSDGTFSKIRQDISQVVRSGFAKIRSDFAQMRPLFKQLIVPGKGTPTPSTTVTLSPSQEETTPSASPSTTP